MTTIFTLPGTATSGDILAIFDNDGFITNGLVSKHLLTDGSGVTAVDAQGGGAASITSDFSSNNASAWLSGGGLRLEGAQILSLPAFDASGAWSLVTYARVVSYIPASLTEAVCGIVGLRAFGAASNVRGAGAYVRGGNITGRLDGTAYFQQRPADGVGARKTIVSSMNGSYRPVVGELFMVVMSYNGTDTLKTFVYSRGGVLLDEITETVSDAQLFTISGTTVTSHNPALGGWNSSFAGGRTQFEAVARYNRYWGGFVASEVTQLVAAGAALATARGR